MMKRNNNLKISIENELLENAKKLREKYPPISENIEGVQKVYPIKKVYQLFKEFKNFYLIIISDSSIEKKMSFQLIQFSLHHNNSRISLLCLLELKNFDELMNLREKLNDIKLSFRDKMEKVIKLSDE